MALAPNRPMSKMARRSAFLATSFEQRFATLLQPMSLTALRVSLAVLFLWFGALKIMDQSPVAHLVTAAVPWADPAWFVPLLGVFEAALGTALVLGRHVTLVSIVLMAHLFGTFLVLVQSPQLAFREGNPLMLTAEGEFVVKNLVLISAAMVLASWSRAKRGHLDGPVARTRAPRAGVSRFSR